MITAAIPTVASQPSRHQQQDKNLKQLLAGKVMTLCRLASREKALKAHHVSFLAFLDAGNKPTMTTVSKMFGFSTAASTGLIDRLEKDGLVRRTNLQGDRRQTLIEITPEGQRTLDRIVSQLRD